MKERADKLLVGRSLAPSREKAQALIMAGLVTAGGRPVAKPGELVDAEAPLEVARPLPFVSRGGLKLEEALDRFGVDVRGLVALDIGASTGGFVDCLLQRGAKRVYAV
ncbi:MAG: TlyA family rRNA (cytidine-2'-O)-methyltransferase, partial [Candidatus Aminicenantes bacterium]|nr:TlyA family rRNA (cytidine-2'-O)-methyltransferase [Candidatus Aminicenantes bacterium]